MIAARIGPELRMAVAGAPSYFRSHVRPRTPNDLTDHAGINIRMQTKGGLTHWNSAAMAVISMPASKAR
ncbi:hypothetical protein [Novosphingobium sp.]|uniref:hypothetical protein n=1 Tax=Novosphingobium sp. TaxID=1874826 RepID=UPI003D6C7DE1